MRARSSACLVDAAVVAQELLEGHLALHLRVVRVRVEQNQRERQDVHLQRAQMCEQGTATAQGTTALRPWPPYHVAGGQIVGVQQMEMLGKVIHAPINLLRFLRAAAAAAAHSLSARGARRPSPAPGRSARLGQTERLQEHAQAVVETQPAEVERAHVSRTHARHHGARLAQILACAAATLSRRATHTGRRALVAPIAVLSTPWKWRRNMAIRSASLSPQASARHGEAWAGRGASVTYVGRSPAALRNLMRCSARMPCEGFLLNSSAQDSSCRRVLPAETHAPTTACETHLALERTNQEQDVGALSDGRRHTPLRALIVHAKDPRNRSHIVGSGCLCPAR